MYLFGSALIKKYFADFREPKDLDYLSNKQVPISNVNYVQYYSIPFAPDRELTPDEIYTLKVSHAIYDISWQKHMSDIRFLQLKGCKTESKFLADLRAFWLTVHTDKKYIRTNFDVDDLFADKIKRKIPHDELHTLINPNPVYKLMVNGFVPNQKKFESLPYETRLQILLEEAYIIGLERFYDLDWRTAYWKAQHCLVTRLHPIWLADSVIDNWNILYRAPKEYKEIFDRVKDIL